MLDLYKIFIAPWTDNFQTTFPIFIMGTLVAATCGLTGVFIILRRMALVGDAISHSLLAGIVIGFLIAGTRATSTIFIGAIAIGILTVLLIEYIHQNTLIKPDAAIGIVFTSLFAIGVILMTLFADNVDLDLECVLYGEIGFVPLEKPFLIGSINLGPYPIIRMLGICLLVVILLIIFYKEMLITTFDPALASCLGFQPKIFQYGLVIVLSLVIVCAFRSVGAILVVAMLLFPGANALLLSKNLKTVLVLTLGLALIYSFGGIHLATWLDASIAGSMTTVAVICFVLTLFFTYCFHRRKRTFLKNMCG